MSLTETCDPEGDIRLTAPLTILGVKQQKTFIVSSKAMRLACKAWNKMLAPDSPFLEAKEVGHGKLSFPEDDAAPLATLLHIAHLNFDKVSPYTSFQLLLDLAVLTDNICY
ncbi:putative nuclear pore protein [Diplodia seriata]|uniref:Putative nuclear pore protein n=1 Tax=Diplodia seriata TaxID=420778 RepID=A0A0G2ETZ0_9PEZI|nr:putative nuclear pore protein [Diplodia seriata]